jgi:hypothetical protein
LVLIIDLSECHFVLLEVMKEIPDAITGVTAPAFGKKGGGYSIYVK